MFSKKFVCDQYLVLKLAAVQDCLITRLVSALEIIDLCDDLFMVSTGHNNKSKGK